MISSNNHIPTVNAIFMYSLNVLIFQVFLVKLLVLFDILHFITNILVQHENLI